MLTCSSQPCQAFALYLLWLYSRWLYLLWLYILWQAFALLHQHAGDTRLPTHTSNQTAPPTDTLPPAGANAGASSNAGAGAGSNADEFEDEPEPAKRVVSAFATANASSVSSASVRVSLSYYPFTNGPGATYFPLGCYCPLPWSRCASS